MYAYKCEAHELTGKRTTETQNKDHEDHIAERGFNSTIVTISCTSFFHVPQAMKILDAKAAVDKEWDKLKNVPVWQESKVKKQTRGDR